jgi:cytochrome c553
MSRVWAALGLFCLVLATATVLFQREVVAAGDRALGQHLSSECVTCHQLTGRFDGIPPIVGWPEQSFIEIMNEYRDKKRPNPVMQTIVGRLSADEIAALATYFGSLKMPEPRKTKGGKS